MPLSLAANELPVVKHINTKLKWKIENQFMSHFEFTVKVGLRQKFSITK